MNDILITIKNLDYSPLYISLITGVAATVISFFLGVFFAGKIYCMKSKWKAVLDGVLTLPMVLPPTVAGFILLIIFSRRRVFGKLLYNSLNIKVVQSLLGCIVAATVIALPIMYKNARAAFEQVDENLIMAARTLGMSEKKIFWRVLIPAAKPGIVSGIVLSFSRAMGEYGATSMLAGNIPGKTSTIAQSIAMVIQDGDYITAGIWVIIVIAIALILIALMNVMGMTENE